MFLVAGQHGLQGAVSDDGSVQALGPPGVRQVLEVGEGLGEREAELVVAQVVGEDAARDLERRRRLAAEEGMYHRQTFLVVQQKLVYAPVQVVEERAVPRKDEAHVQTS